MSEPVGNRRGIQQNPKPPRGCHIFLIVSLLIILLIAFFALKDIFHPTKKAEATSDLTKVIFWTLGGSETHGYGAAVSFSWPMQLEPYFEKKYPETKLFVINSTIPDANSSEGLEIVKTYLEKYNQSPEQEQDMATTMQKPDYAMVCFGINNRWNLQSGTFADWPSDELTDPEFRSALSIMKVKKPEELTKIPRKQYFKHWDEEGWEVFFESFNNPFLTKWIKSDLTSIVELIRKNDIEPILLTYYYDRFPELNTLIKQIGQETDTTVLDVETPTQYFATNQMILYQDTEDPKTFQINSEGYNYLAKKVVNQFSKFYPQEAVLQKN